MYNRLRVFVSHSREPVNSSLCEPAPLLHFKGRSVPSLALLEEHDHLPPLCKPFRGSIRTRDIRFVPLQESAAGCCLRAGPGSRCSAASAAGRRRSRSRKSGLSASLIIGSSWPIWRLPNTRNVQPGGGVEDRARTAARWLWRRGPQLGSSWAKGAARTFDEREAKYSCARTVGELDGERDVRGKKWKQGQCGVCASRAARSVTSSNSKHSQAHPGTEKVHLLQAQQIHVFQVLWLGDGIDDRPNTGHHVRADKSDPQLGSDGARPPPPGTRPARRRSRETRAARSLAAAPWST